MSRLRATALGIVAARFILVAEAAAGVPGLRVPAGFEVAEVAGPELANDIVRLAIDDAGRIVVAGRGYLRTLVDDDGDGRADRAVTFADGPKDGAMGLLIEGETLFAVGDGGLWRYRDADGDGRADEPPDLLLKLKTGGEHDAHSVRRGPDGWLYVLCGNNTGIDASYAQTSTSPIREPIAGALIRLAPDLKTTEVVADGFRNAYGFDFGPDGSIFAFDSDNERCVALPWYEPTRLYHVVEGGHHGWRAPQRDDFWRVPPDSIDVAAPIATLGRGSPTGVATYRHDQFPKRYRGGLFLLDWTFGKVHFVALEPSGSTFVGHPEVFLEATGSEGFAPTDIVVDPATEDLLVSIGGRGTRGAVFRVRYVGEDVSRAGPRAIRSHSLEWSEGLGPKLVEVATGGDDPARLRALIDLRRHRDRIDPEALRSAVVANWDRPDRTIRRATADLLADIEDVDRWPLAGRVGSPRSRVTFALGIVADRPLDALGRAARIVAGATIDPTDRLGAVRVVQLALGGLTDPSLRGTVWEGYSPLREPKASEASLALASLRTAFPSGDAALDRELARTLAMLRDDDPATFAGVVAMLGEPSDPIDETHALIVASRLTAPRTPEATARIAHALLGLDRKLDARGARRDRYWPLRLVELVGGLIREDATLPSALLDDPEFGRPDHALFALATGFEFDRPRAAEALLARAEADPSIAWSAPMVALIGSLPASRSRPALRSQWGVAGLDDAILAALAREPDPVDRPKFLRGLASPDPSTVRAALGALEALPRGGLEDRDDFAVGLVRALGRLPDGKAGAGLRDRIDRSLRSLEGGGPDGPGRSAWAAWLAEARPALSGRLAGEGNGGIDLAAWADRQARIEPLDGDPGRGLEAFRKASCASCHSGGLALGPDLRGVAGRFSRADLFAAIVQPGRDVPMRYRTILVELADGQVHRGMVVYEAADGLIVQTGAASTVRLASDEVVARRDAPGSLMPDGLLDPLSDREVADLFAYLASLGDGGR